MNLPDFSIKRPVTTLMVTLIAVLLGGISFVRIPVDLMPEIVYPMLSVSGTYEGVAPEEMETLVARPLEEAFAAAPGVEEITSTSTEGQAFIRVGFEYGQDLDVEAPTWSEFELAQLDLFHVDRASCLEARETEPLSLAAAIEGFKYS